MVNAKLFRHTATAVLFSALILAASSCGSETTAEQTETQAVTAGTTEAETEETEFTFSGELESADYGGAAFRVLAANDIGGSNYVTAINYAEELNGEIINDTMYQRDLWIEETYNVDLQFTIIAWETTAFNQKINNVIAAGEDAFELMMDDVAEVAKTQCIKGQIFPLNLIDGIELDAEYWYPEINKDLWVGENLYIAANAINAHLYGCAYPIVVNKDLANRLDLPNLYDMVADGTWTYDAMVSFAKLAVSDVNGDGVMDDEDQYGLIWHDNAATALVMGANLTYMKNEDGHLVMQMDDEKLVSYMLKLDSSLHESWALCANLVKYDVDAMQNNGQALFCMPCVADIAPLREADWDFGILPVPKYDEAQEEYYSFAMPWALSSPMIPVTVPAERIGMVGTVVNAMAAYGYDYVRPAVYDNVLKTKTARDEESAAIIDLVFENITPVWATFYSFGGFYEQFHSFFQKEDADVASKYEKIRTKVEKAIVTLEETLNANAADCAEALNK